MSALLYQSHPLWLRIFAILNFLYSFGVDVYFIVLFILFGHEKCSQPVATFMIVTAAIGLSLVLFFLLSHFCCDELAWERHSGLYTCILFFLLFLTFACFVVGNVFVFSTSQESCNRILYLSAFIYIIVCYGRVTLAFLVCCCLLRVRGGEGTYSLLYLQEKLGVPSSFIPRGDNEKGYYAPIQAKEEEIVT